MKVLVIGASGFLGSTIAKQFLEQSAEVWGTYHEKPKDIPEGCQTVSVSAVGDLDATFDVVVMAAGNHSLSPKELIDINVHLTQRVVDKFHSAKLIFISSVAVYGDHKDVISELSAFNNPSFYGLAKLAGESVAQTHPHYAILRLTYLYGKGMPTNSFLPTIIQKAKAEKEITLFGKGERLQDYLHVKDAARLCVKSADNRDNDIYLGATGRSLSNLEVVKAIQQNIPDCQLKFNDTDTATWFRFDPLATKAKLNWMPVYEFDSAIKELM